MKNKQCSKCGKNVPENQLTMVENKFYCDICKPIPCIKCKKLFTIEDLRQLRRGYICKNCQRKKILLLVLLIFAIISIIAGVLYYNNMEGFVEENNVNTELPIQNVFDMKMVTATNMPSLGSPIDNIEGFMKIYQESVASSESTSAKFLAIPSIFMLFDLNSAKILDNAKELLSCFIDAYLASNQQATIVVEGFGCNLGNKKENLIVSQKRAMEVKNMLMQNGVSEDKIEIHFWGKEKNYEFNYNTLSDYRRVIISIK